MNNYPSYTPTKNTFGIFSINTVYLALERNNYYVYQNIHPLFHDGPGRWYRQIRVDNGYHLEEIKDDRLINVLEERKNKMILENKS